MLGGNGSYASAAHYQHPFLDDMVGPSSAVLAHYQCMSNLLSSQCHKRPRGILLSN